MKTPEISVNHLQKWLEKGKEVQILDIRPLQQREEWFIDGSIHENVYWGLIEGDLQVLDHIKLDRQKPVVTVCAAGKTSRIAANILLEKGFNVYSLSGGMKAWNYAWSIAEIEEKDLKIIQVRRMAKGCLSYIIGSGEEAIVIDAALDPEVYTAIAKENNWRITSVMDTHIHADYISRTRELAGVTGAKHRFIECAEVDYPFIAFRDNEYFEIGNSFIQVMHSPGHTPESVCYLVNGQYLISGDTLFVEGVGRPDLKAAEKQVIEKAHYLFESLQKIQSLAEETFILPAHTSKAIGFDRQIWGAPLAEIRNSIHILKLSKEEFVKQTIQRIPLTPPNYLEIANLNKIGNYTGTDPADLEAGANRCAVS